MAAPKIEKPAALAKRGGRNRAGRKPSATVGYAFAGDVFDLPEAVAKVVVKQGFRTVLIPETLEAEAALKLSERFRRVRIIRFTAKTTSQTEQPNALTDQSVQEFRATIAAEAFQPDARAKAILRGKSFAEQDLKAAGGAFDVDEVRALLNGVSRQAVDKRVSDGTLLTVPGPSGRRRFPTVQFNHDGRAVKGLKEVQKALSFSSPWAVLNFLVNENDHLSGRRPIEVLHEGDVEVVVAAANTTGVQGA